MSFLYKIISNGIYFTLWPYARMRAGLGNKLWRGRLGLIDNLPDCDIWIHAASVGETKVAGYLIEYLVRHNPKIRIYLTTMTTAGQKIAKSLKSENVSTGFFPIDHKTAISKTLNQIKPRMLIIAETEIWPNLIVQSSRQNIPIILINGRMSDKAFKKYKLISKTMKGLLTSYERFFVKTESDKEKFSFFGVTDDKLCVAGDMKFDAPLLPRSEGRRQEIRSRIGVSENDFVFVAGSTRPGEEVLLLRLYKELQSQQRKVRLIIAPRHLKRITELKIELGNHSVEVGMYGTDENKNSVILVDQMGLLDDLYLASDLAFVGGTLVNIGGHNILEPVWAGTPVVFGPFTNNVNEARDYILQNNYGAMASNIDELIDMVQKFVGGQLKFNIKRDEDSLHSPTSVAGQFVQERLSHA